MVIGWVGCAAPGLAVEPAGVLVPAAQPRFAIGVVAPSGPIGVSR
jgi:hypothetical protein